MNTNGGGLSYTHSGMYGMYTLIELTRQLRGECGERQVQGARTALVHGTGGTLGVAHSGATLVLARD
jgi:acetyl-CoA acetyltransferase